MGIKSKKVMLGKGVEVKERTFEKNRKNVIKLKNRKMYRIMVEIGVLNSVSIILSRSGNENVKKEFAVKNTIIL
jgi:phosphatidylserine decarboxylase